MGFLTDLGKAADSLREAGAWGFIVILVVCVWRLSARLDEAHAAILSAWKESGQIAKDTAVALANWTASNDASTRAFESSVKSQELSAATQLMVKATLDAQLEETKALHRSLEQMREAVIRAGVSL